jgi:hypothetical protein
MKRFFLILPLLAAGCTQGLIGEVGASAGADGIRLHSLALGGTTTAPRTVTLGEREDTDGAIDQTFRFDWTLADCHAPDCLPVDAGAGRSHVFRIRATGAAGEVAYKKVTLTLYAD